MVYVISAIIVLGFFTYEFRLIHIKKNRRLYQECFPMTKEKYCNLTQEESDYLNSLLTAKYKDTIKKDLLLCINKRLDISDKDFFGLDKSNEERAALNETDIFLNTSNINRLSKGIIPKLTGWRCSKIIKFIVVMGILCIISTILSLIFK